MKENLDNQNTDVGETEEVIEIQSEEVIEMTTNEPTESLDSQDEYIGETEVVDDTKNEEILVEASKDIERQC